MTTYFIVPGWSEGHWHIEHFKKQAGIKTTAQPQTADILICHSSGCYSLPKLKPTQIIVLIDPPYWPDKNIVKRAVRHVILDIPKQINSYGLVFWLNMRAHNIVYALLAPLKHTIHAHRSLKKELLSDLKANEVLLIRNDLDAYCSPDIVKFESSRVRVKTLPGLHEDCWARPADIISLTDKL